MAHYKSNWSDPSHYCHPAMPCATKPLNVVLLVQTFHLNSRHHLSTPRRNTAWYLLQNSQIKGDGRVLTSGTISGGSYGVSATRQLATTKPLRHNNISEPRKLNCSVGLRERALSVFLLIGVGGEGCNQRRQGGCSVTTNFPPILATTGTHNNL